MISLDTETTGLDLRHGSRPFFVTTCTEEGEQLFWEWDVDPLTREVTVPPEDLVEIRDALVSNAPYVLQNAKFDVTAMASVGLWDVMSLDEAWGQIDDTIVSGHCLKSTGPLNLTDMAMEYLGERIDHLERSLRDAVTECRRSIQQAKNRVKRAAKKGEASLFGDDPLVSWKIARDDDPDLPSGGDWHSDYWLPRAMAKHLWESTGSHEYRPPNDAVCETCGGVGLGAGRSLGPDGKRCSSCDGTGRDRGHPWWTVLRDYGNKDSEVTVGLWQVHRDLLERRGQWAQYLERRKLLRATYEMECGGVTYSRRRMDEQFPQYEAMSEERGRRCVLLAKKHGCELTLPNGAAVNNSLREACFVGLKLPQYQGAKSKTTNPSLDKNVIARYLDELPEGSDQREFVRAFAKKRKLDTSLQFMRVYREYARDHGDDDTQLMYPSVNVTGTSVTRMSSERPNEQQISAKEVDQDEEDEVRLRNLRYLFGPPPGREWWRMDYENIELRIPAYRFQEPSMVELFERPDDAPYFGSYHLLNASIVFPELFWPLAETKGAFKDRHPDVYKRVKNGGFCKQYGGQRRKTDATFGRQGAFDLLESNLTKIAEGNAQCVAFANKYGYVEIVPDRTVDPKRGYRVVVARGDRGWVSPTEPFSYFIQGTAGWCGNKALVRCTDQLRSWRERGVIDGRVVFYVHDELVFELPKGGRKNLPKVCRLQSLMAESGDDVGIPLKVSVSYHPENWAEEAPCT